MKNAYKLLMAMALCAVFTSPSAAISISTGEANWRSKLNDEIQHNLTAETLNITLAEPIIPPLPKSNITHIRLSCDPQTAKPLSLLPLSEFSLTSLTSSVDIPLQDLDGIDRSKLESLSTGIINAREFSIAFPELRTLDIWNLQGKELDLSKVPKLQKLSIYKCQADLNLILPPDTQLHTLRIDAGAFDVLKKINTAKLQHLGLLPKKTPQDVSELSRMDFPRLETLLLNLGDRQLKLPRLPNLRHLTIYSAGEIDLQHLQKQLPRLHTLVLDKVSKVRNWEVLPELPLNYLHIGAVENIKYSLPADPPRGCCVSGLPVFIENPYKMWGVWAICTLLLAIWTYIYRLRKRKERK